MDSLLSRFLLSLLSPPLFLPPRSSVAVFSPMHTWTPTHNLEFAQNLIRRIQQKDLTYEQLLKQYSLYDTTTTADHGELAQRIAFAVDSRPKAPTLVSLGKAWREGNEVILCCSSPAQPQCCDLHDTVRKPAVQPLHQARTDRAHSQDTQNEREGLKLGSVCV